jgi:hypothetical protein
VLNEYVTSEVTMGTVEQTHPSAAFGGKFESSTEIDSPLARKDLNSAAVKTGSVVTAEFGFNLHYTGGRGASSINHPS